MKTLSLLLLACFAVLISNKTFAQSDNKKNNYVKFAAGRVSFGTGDFFGYGVNIEYSKRIKGKAFLKHFLIGAELSFEDGNQQPKVINPTLQEFFSAWYYSTTNIVFTPKITYYPFNRTFAKGINITGGLSVGYTNQSSESQATYIYDSNTQMSVRRSYLDYINQVIFGYRITAGYEFFITKHILIGGRLDFDSYSNGDINTLIAAKCGFSF